MSFIPQTPVDTSAVLGSLRVSMQNHVHAGERAMDVALDTLSDLTHQTAVAANAYALSGLEWQQSLMTSRNYNDIWHFFADHHNRMCEHYFKYLDECFACRHRALERLHAEDGYVG